MVNPIRSSSRCQAGTIEVRAEFSNDSPGSPPGKATGWVVRTPSGFLDDRAGGLGHRKGWMLLLLESYCRTRCYCWTGNAELAAAYGCSESTVHELLRDMEAGGLIRRVPAASGRPGRLGIILMRRADADLPTASEADLPEIVRQMHAAREGRGKAQPAPRANAASHRGKLGAQAPENRGLNAPGKSGAQIVDVVVKENGPERRTPIQPVQRQRPETPTPAGSFHKFTSPCSTSTTQNLQALQAPPCPGPDDLTPGQAAWIAGLDPCMRAGIDALTPPARARLLAPHRLGRNDDPILEREAYRILSAAAPTTPTNAPAPATPAELLLSLPGAPPSRPQQAAELLARDFGGDRDRKLWPAFLAVTQAVWEGRFPAESLADAYRQGMGPKARNRGAVFNHALQSSGWQWRR